MYSNKQLILKEERRVEIYSLLDKLNLGKPHLELLIDKQTNNLHILNEALTHTSSNSNINHERLEFLGDAVLRLAASEYIQNYFPKLKVGERSALRAQLVSDEWLAKVGSHLNIKQIMITGAKAKQDNFATSTLEAEATEALIGALYECLHDVKIIQKWLKPYWDKESKFVLSDPYKNNSKSALQELSQGKGWDKPIYKTLELCKEHGNIKRFYSKVFLNGEFKGEGWGSSIKKAEKEAALMALKKI